jgi:hypothetical protein
VLGFPTAKVQEWAEKHSVTVPGSYPNADGYGFKDADWITIKMATR